MCDIMLTLSRPFQHAYVCLGARLQYLAADPLQNLTQSKCAPWLLVICAPQLNTAPPSQILRPPAKLALLSQI